MTCFFENVCYVNNNIWWLTVISRQRRIIRPHSSSESDSEDSRIVSAPNGMNKNTSSTQESKMEDINTLRQMFPTLSEDKLRTVLKNNDNNVDQAANDIMYPTLPGKLWKWCLYFQILTKVKL